MSQREEFHAIYLRMKLIANWARGSVVGPFARDPFGCPRP